jgi:(p)ppGpp synthase/HD superfamily hydrolase
MTDFEKWLQTTPEYQTLVFQHGERLFIQRDGEYAILPVRLAHRIHKLATMKEMRVSSVNCDIENFDLYTPLQSR